MANIELVIKIPEEIRLALINNIQLSLDQQFICDSSIKQAIINGTPLPKGHGRLIDVDAIVYEKECVYLSDGGCTTESTPNISATPTIIEANKENEDGNALPNDERSKTCAKCVSFSNSNTCRICHNKDMYKEQEDGNVD